MNIGNVVVLSLLIALLLFLMQRIERRRLWIALLALLPALLIYRWAIYRSQTAEALTALGIAAAINVLFWLTYGRRHPPSSSDEIVVKGMEDR